MSNKSKLALSNNSSQAEIKQLKRDAKNLSKNDGIPHHRALDLIAGNLGFRNWPLLMKSSSSINKLSESLKLTSQPPGDITGEPKFNFDCDGSGGTPDALPSSIGNAPRRFWLVSSIGKEFAISAPKVRMALATNGFLNADGKPSQRAYELGIVQTRKTEDRFNGRGIVEYYAWDIDYIRQFFEEPSELSKFLHITGRHSAENKLDHAFVRAGRALKLLPDSIYELDGSIKKQESRAIKLGVSEDTYWALVRAAHGDLVHPGDMAFLERKVDLIRLRERITPEVDEIYSALKRRRGMKSEADFFLASVDGIFDWMMRQLR